MAVYSYRATTPDGKITEGVIEAADERSAVERLRNTGIIPLRISSPDEGVRRRFFSRSARGDLLIFTTELSALLHAGLPLDRGLNIISDISESREMKQIVKTVLKSIREGSSFSDALQKHPRVFPRLYVNMVRAGEAGGVLDAVLEKLSEFLEAAKELREHIVSAMIYPVILLATGALSIIVLLAYVLPKFSVIFADLGVSLPLATRIIITVSAAITSYWWVAAVMAVAGGVLFRNYLRTEAGRYAWDAFKLRMLGETIRKIEAARFSRTLGTLLQSGVPLLQALVNAKDTISNRVIAGTIDTVVKGAKEGKGISDPLEQVHALPPLALSMIRVGEETGQLDTMLLKVASIYEKGLRVSIKRLMGVLEPAMILGMGLVIGFIVLSMLMAIFSMTELPF